MMFIDEDVGTNGYEGDELQYAAVFWFEDPRYVHGEDISYIPDRAYMGHPGRYLRPGLEVNLYLLPQRQVVFSSMKVDR